jgi:NAD(P)-dependent dehydrogenase (short-subunit alcohol dehydrogenase family)
LLRRCFTKPKPLPAGTRVDGQVAVITGSNVGLGLAASRQLLKLGLSHLVMGVRSQAKGEAAAEGLRKEFSSATVTVWTVDLESYESVSAFADKCATLPRLDIAILNAGLLKPSFETVPATGHEVTMQVNYYSTVLMAIRLAAIQKEKKVAGSTRPPVLNIVSSDAAYTATLSAKQGSSILQHLDAPGGFGSAFDQYQRTKLLEVMFGMRLAEAVSAEDVLVNVSNPGMTKGTAFFSFATGVVAGMVSLLQGMFAREVDVGASTYLDAVLGHGAESHGSFMSDWTIKP